MLHFNNTASEICMIQVFRQFIVSLGTSVSNFNLEDKDCLTTHLLQTRTIRAKVEENS